MYHGQCNESREKPSAADMAPDVDPDPGTDEPARRIIFATPSLSQYNGRISKSFTGRLIDLSEFLAFLCEVYGWRPPGGMSPRCDAIQSITSQMVKT
jgi:hypothetical protein